MVKGINSDSKKGGGHMIFLIWSTMVKLSSLRVFNGQGESPKIFR